MDERRLDCGCCSLQAPDKPLDDQPTITCLPTDLAGLLSCTAELLPPRITDALSAAEPLGEIAAQHYPASVWRRYDKLDRLPKGLLVLGDAVCSLNPVYGQGMTSAALQAKALRQCLAAPGIDDVGRSYFRSAARKLAPMWHANRFNDFAVSPVAGWRSIPQRVVNWHTDKMMAAAADDIVLTESFMRVLQLLDSPVGLLRPALSMRVVTGNRRRRGRTGGDVPAAGS